MVTGVSLKGADTVLVPLRQSADKYVPLMLAFKGNYNRLGSIDGIGEDANTRLVMNFFLEKLRTGEFTVEEESLRSSDCFPIKTIDDLVQGFERNINDGAGSSVLNGESVVFALIARAIWDGIARAAPTRAESIPTLFERLFEASPAASQIYAGRLEAVTAHIRELGAVDLFLTKRRLSWQVSEGMGQDSAGEMRQYLEEARQLFSDSPTILAALRDYEHEVGDLLKDE
jgi:hypothetical protein